MKNFLRSGRSMLSQAESGPYFLPAKKYAKSSSLKPFDTMVVRHTAIVKSFVGDIFRICTELTEKVNISPHPTAYSPWLKAFLIIFCVLFSGFWVSPAFGQEAQGPNRIGPLKVGDVVPDDFWTQEHLLYTNGDTVRTTLEQYRGKLLVLDFWMVGCSKCFFHQSEINYFKSRYNEVLAVVMVNGMRTKNDYKGIHKFLNGDWITGLGLTSVSSIIESEYLDSLFNPSAYPAYYWINKMGILQTVTFRNLLDRNYSAPFLDN